MCTCTLIVSVVVVVVVADFHRIEDFDLVMRQIYGPRVEIVYTHRRQVYVDVRFVL